MCISAASLDIIIRGHWLTEPHRELVASCVAIAILWSPLHRSLLAAAIREYTAVEQARDIAYLEERQGEDTLLFDQLVAERPDNFDLFA